MKRLLRILAVLCLPTLALAQSSTGYQQITVSTTAVAITASVRQGATQCRGRLEQAPIRVLWSNGTPTASSGNPVSIGDEVQLNNAPDIVNFRAIASTPGSPSGLLNMACANGTTAAASQIVPTTTSQANLPVCNLLLRAAGTACR